MKFVKFAIATTALFGFASAAQAQDTGAYVAVGVDAVEFDAYALGGKIGYNFSEYFGVEGQAAVGIIDDEVGGVDIGVDTSFGGFGVARFPVSEKFDLFARAGYHFTEFSASDGSVSIGVDSDGFALGAGGTYWLNDRSGIRLEYTYLDVNFDDDLDAEGGGGDVVSLSYQYKF